MSSVRGTPTPAGMVYGPTASGKLYLCSKEHRGANRRKSRWAETVPPDREYGLFCTADKFDWYELNGDYWGVLGRDAEELGTSHERIAKFPSAADSPSARWHGYPASPITKGAADAPGDAFVNAWLASGTITRTVARRIQRRRI